MKNNLRYLWPLHFVLFLTNWLPDNIVFIRLRGFLASFFFKKCGKNLRLGRNLTFYKSYEMEFGDNIYIAYGAWFCGKIIVEDEVMFGPYCMLAPSNHTAQNGSFRYGGYSDKGAIIVRSGAWVGGMSSLVSGAIVSKKGLLAANSVLTKEMEEGSIYGGTPAKFIGWVNEVE
jgi:acetyltransferase-like isoleucine patch superfamily enzyme